MFAHFRAVSWAGREWDDPPPNALSDRETEHEILTKLDEGWSVDEIKVALPLPSWWDREQ